MVGSQLYILLWTMSTHRARHFFQTYQTYQLYDDFTKDTGAECHLSYMTLEQNSESLSLI